MLLSDKLKDESDTSHSTTRYRLSALTGVPENAWIWYSYICLGSLEKKIYINWESASAQI